MWYKIILQLLQYNFFKPTICGIVFKKMQSVQSSFCKFSKLGIEDILRFRQDNIFNLIRFGMEFNKGQLLQCNISKLLIFGIVLNESQELQDNTLNPLILGSEESEGQLSHCISFKLFISGIKDNDVQSVQCNIHNLSINGIEFS